MICAADTSVLLDVLLADPVFGPRSRAALQAAHRQGSVIACEVVWAEIGARFPDEVEATSAMRQLGVEYRPMQLYHALAAGSAWSAYRRAGGPRTRVVADFLVGAHAMHAADRLLTRDRGFYRTYFSGLEILDPSIVA